MFTKAPIWPENFMNLCYTIYTIYEFMQQDMLTDLLKNLVLNKYSDSVIYSPG